MEKQCTNIATEQENDDLHDFHVFNVWQRDTFKLIYSDGNLSVMDIESWSLHDISFHSYIGNNRNPLITDKICRSLVIRYCGGTLNCV